MSTSESQPKLPQPHEATPLDHAANTIKKIFSKMLYACDELLNRPPEERFNTIFGGGYMGIQHSEIPAFDTSQQEPKASITPRVEAQIQEILDKADA
jgi:hypothetical protein